jgi:hypothetical protein
VVGFVHGWVGIDAGIVHDAINEVIHDSCNAVNSSEPFVEGRKAVLLVLAGRYAMWLTVHV